ncbi:MAG: aldo/keto reductase family oxidoreductase [Puniceicoccaceae bacterium]
MSSLPVYSCDSGRSLDYPLAEGLNAKRLALGCMQFAGSWEPDAAIPESARKRARGALETALELGWDYYDHADIYCRGRSEVLFGELVRDLKVERESIIVQSKCGIRFPDDPQPGDPHRYDFSKDHIIWSAEASLQRLGMDYLDIFLFHRPDFLARPEEMLEAMATLKASGKVRHFGVSNFTPPLLDLFEAAGFVPVVNQVEVNLLRSSLIDGSMVATADRDPEAGHPADGTLEWHRRRGVVTQAWAPMAYGYLCGREPDWEPERVGPAAECVQRIAGEHGVSPEAVVIGWLLKHPAMIQPVIGSQDPGRLKGCHEALSLELSREEWYTLYLAGRGRPLP